MILAINFPLAQQIVIIDCPQYSPKHNIATYHLFGIIRHPLSQWAIIKI